MPLAFTTGTSSHPKNTLQKRKFEIKVLLLLHILIPGVMPSSLETINPWLSACDLKQQDPSDLKGSCSATPFPARTTPLPDVELPCPKECPPNESKTNASCLAYLDEARRTAICNFNLGNGIEWLKSFLGTIRLRHCCEYKIIESLPQSLLERVLGGKDECFRIIDSLVEVDNLAARVTCEFSEILSRYDCGQPYSVKFSCEDCLEAYRRWVCSTLVPYFNESTRIRPCRSVCQAVEQKCPYFLPENKAPALPTQYAGEPTFLCMDPNIPETGEQQKRSLYPDKNTCCVKVCGSLKDGLCVDKRTQCKNEDLISYEEALDQAVECSSGDTLGSRVPSIECAASEPYNSPHKLGSRASKTLPGPILILTAYLNFSQAPLRLHYLIIFLVLHYYFFPLSFLKIFACIWIVDCFSSTHLLLSRIKVKATRVIRLIKRCSLIHDYFKFSRNQWHYYFIFITISLLLKNPEPSTTPPPCLLNGFVIGKSEKARRAKYYYYFYYYNYFNFKHYYTILSRIAQNSNKNYLNSRKSCDSTRIPLDLVFIIFQIIIIINKKNRDEMIFIKKNIKNDNSLTINRNKIHSDTLIIIIVLLLINEFEFMRRKVGIAEASILIIGLGWVRRKRNDSVAASAIFLNEGENSKGVFRQNFPPRHAKVYGLEKKSVILILVKIKCRLTRLKCSDPKCEFQTFLKKKKKS